MALSYRLVSRKKPLEHGLTTNARKNGLVKTKAKFFIICLVELAYPRKMKNPHARPKYH